MRTTALIALSLIAGLMGGIAVAGVAGFGPLAYISYHIMAPQAQQGAMIIPAYINLGNLTPSQAGVVKASATLDLKTNGTFKVILLHREKFSKVFSNFTVVLQFSNNKTVVLSLTQTMENITLSSGNYTVLITLYFTVSSSPHGDLNVFKEPFIIIHPVGQGED